MYPLMIYLAFIITRSVGWLLIKPLAVAQASEPIT